MITYIYRYIFVALATAWYGSRIVIGSWRGHSSAELYSLGLAWARSLLKHCRVGTEVYGREKLEAGKPYLILSNHRSHFDPPTLIAVIEEQVHFVAKKELSRVPIFGPTLSALDMVYINRSDGSEARRSIETAAELIKGGRRVLMFPEGTRARKAGLVQPFKKGAFHLALEARVPLLPVVVLDSEKILPKYSLAINSGNIRVFFCDPINVCEGDTVNSLIEKVQNAMNAVIVRETRN